MSVIAFVNGSLGAQALRVLSDRLVAVVLHEEANRRDADQLLAAIPTGVPVCGPRDDLSQFGASHGCSVFYGHILSQSVIDLFPEGIANLHPSYLPFGRGAHPNAWSIASGEPAGITLHLIDSHVDTGPILVQKHVPVFAVDTAKSLYLRLLDEAAAVLSEWLNGWLNREFVPRPQSALDGSAHKVRDLYDMNKLVAGDILSVGEVIDRLRATTFSPHPGCIYEIDGKRYRLRIDIEEDIDE